MTQKSPANSQKTREVMMKKLRDSRAKIKISADKMAKKLDSK
jgi:hypothetical protein